MDVVKKQKKLLWPLLLLSILCLVALIYIVLTFPPGSFFTILSIHISYLPLFFILLFLGIYGIVAFFLKSALQGILIAGLVVVFLLFRIFNLTNPLFLILLLILFFCIEGVLWKKK